MKRELAYVMEAQSQLTEPLGRTRRSTSVTDNGRSNEPDDLHSNGAIAAADSGVRVYERSKKFKAEAADNYDGGSLGLGDSRSGFEGDQSEGKVVISSECNGNLVIEAEAEARKNEMVEVEVRQEESIALDLKSNNKSRRFTRSALKPPVEDKEMENGDLEGFKDAVVMDSEVVENGTVGAVGKLEMKMSKKIEITGIPTTVRELFETGLLEGYPVFYNGGKKVWRFNSYYFFFFLSILPNFFLQKLSSKNAIYGLLIHVFDYCANENFLC